MKLDKSHTKLMKMTHEDDSFVAGPPAVRVGMIWELTQELWSLRNRQKMLNEDYKEMLQFLLNNKATGQGKRQTGRNHP